MNTKDIEERQTELNNLILEMAQYAYTSEQIKEVADNLLDIYCIGGFRHTYSKFYMTLSKVPGEFDGLADNLTALKEYVFEHQKYESIATNVFKLWDHLNLEIARIQTAQEHNQKFLDVESRIKALSEENRRAEELARNVQLSTANLANKAIVLGDKIEKLNEQSDQIKNSINDSAATSITILSIFTGIVMAFVGGFSILGSAFSNNLEIFQNHIFLLFLLVAIVGFILFNTIFVFIYTAAKISGKKISVNCRDKDCISCKKCEECKMKTKRFKWCSCCRVLHKYPYVAYVNVVLLLVMFICLAISAYRGFSH